MLSQCSVFIQDNSSEEHFLFGDAVTCDQHITMNNNYMRSLTPTHFSRRFTRQLQGSLGLYRVFTNKLRFQPAKCVIV